LKPLKHELADTAITTDLPLEYGVMVISHDGGIPEDIGIYVYVPVSSCPECI